MTRPLSDADTMVMPELHLTVPMALVRADERCGWCDIRLTAVPQQARSYFRPGESRATLFHPGCVTAQRQYDTV